MKPAKTVLIPAERIESRILFIRDQKIILDADLAELYGVTTKRLNEQVKRNMDRFPSDFTFQLTMEEKEQVVANCDHLARLKFSPVLPYAFTEYGTIMAANVLSSPRAVQVSISIVRAFIKLRNLLTSNKELARKLKALETKYDAQFKGVFDALRQLMMPPDKPRRPIGFARSKEKEPK